MANFFIDRPIFAWVLAILSDRDPGDFFIAR